MSDHAVISRYWPGAGWPRPEPWQRTYTCSCGHEFVGWDEEGSGYADIATEYEEHLAEVAPPDEEDD